MLKNHIHPCPAQKGVGENGENEKDEGQHGSVRKPHDDRQR